MLRGSASVNLPQASRVRVINTRGETISRILDAAIPTTQQVGSGSPLSDPFAATAIFRSSRDRGGVVPSTSVFSGMFVGGVSAGTTGSPRIVLPTGLTLVLNVDAAGNYTVAAVEQTVTLSNGTTQVVTSSTNATGQAAVIGATLTLTNNTGTGGSVSFSLTTSTGGTITPSAAQAAITADLTAAAPAGSTIPTLNPVDTGTFLSQTSS